MVVAVLNGSDAGAASEDGAKMVSAPVSVDIFTRDEANFKGKFSSKLKIKMQKPEALDNETTCAYWNETESRWMSDGLVTVWANDSVTCETDHLTLFALVLLPFEEARLAIACSNIGILAPDKLANIFRGTWPTRTPAIVLNTSFCIYIVVMLCAYFFDRSHRQNCTWKREFLLIEGEEESVCWLKEVWRDVVQTLILDTIGVVKNADKLKFVAAARDAEAEGEDDEVGEQAWASARDAKKASCCLCFQIKRFAHAFTKFAAVSLLSGQTQVEKDDLRHHIQLSKASSADSEEERKKVGQQVSPIVLKRVHRGHSDTFGDEIRDANPLQDIGILILSQTPIHGTFRYSVFISSSMQAALLGASMIGPAMLSALFFSTTGEALSLESSDACSVENYSSRYYIRNIIVGMFSWLLTTLPLLLLTYMVKKKFVTRKQWDDASKRRQLFRWDVQDNLVYWGLVVYTLFCELFCLSFLANVNPKDESKWLIAVATVLAEDFVIGPVIVALILAIVYYAVRCCRPEVIGHTLDELRLPDTSHLFYGFVIKIVGAPPEMLLKKGKVQSRTIAVVEATIKARFSEAKIYDEHISVRVLGRCHDETGIFVQVQVTMPHSVEECHLRAYRDTVLLDELRTNMQAVACLSGLNGALDAVKFEYKERPSLIDTDDAFSDLMGSVNEQLDSVVVEDIDESVDLDEIIASMEKRQAHETGNNMDAEPIDSAALPIDGVEDEVIVEEPTNVECRSCTVCVATSQN
eukprot:TRINITY_DN17924_c0_g1_i1.p1 TRINITY_DN17924_c0_g1~~TRINITY_DN17924_c0_g1_i1.p1  ORF type:complete len:818 (-),score=124.44 TRINITY_DN17924_c0_g1_i1:143-2392(-)